MLSKTLAFVAVGALVLSGCTAADLRGTPAASPEECRADWAQERRAASGGVVNTGSLGAAIATLVVSSAISADRKQAANDRFRACMARFGVADIEAYFGEDLDTAVIATPAQSVPVRSGFDAPSAATLAPRSPGCPANASVLYGGATYCTGR